MTFMRKFLDLLTIKEVNSNNTTSNNKTSEQCAHAKPQYEDIRQYIIPSKNETVYEDADHSIVRIHKGKGVTSKCVTPPPRVNEPQFLSEKMEHEYIENIFYDSNIPVVNKCKTVRRAIRTFITRDCSLNVKISRSDFYFYDIDKACYSDYIALIENINNALMAHNINTCFHVTTKGIKFKDSKTKIAKSSIRYDYEKNLFVFYFTNDIEKSYSVGTEYGEIVVDECGRIVKASFNKWIDGNLSKSRFKGYKTGFDLYDLKYCGEIIYKRESK